MGETSNGELPPISFKEKVKNIFFKKPDASIPTPPAEPPREKSIQQILEESQQITAKMNAENQQHLDILKAASDRQSTQTAEIKKIIKDHQDKTL